MPKKKAEAEKENSERWLLTYADMITLLMLFFIVLYSMSNVDSEKYKAISKALQTIFEGGNMGIFQPSGMYPQKGFDEYGGNSMQGSQFPYSTRSKLQTRILKQVNEVFKPEMTAKYISTRIDERGLVITLTGDFFFDGGSAKLNKEMEPVLIKVAGILNEVPNFVRIEGHTDNSRLSAVKTGEGYDNNWDLSAARSLNVLKFLVEDGRVEPKKLSSVAFGEYRPIEDNNLPEGRAYNRRVDIVILKERLMQSPDDKRIERPLPDEEWEQ